MALDDIRDDPFEELPLFPANYRDEEDFREPDGREYLGCFEDLLRHSEKDSTCKEELSEGEMFLEGSDHSAVDLDIIGLSESNWNPNQNKSKRRPSPVECKKTVFRGDARLLRHSKVKTDQAKRRIPRTAFATILKVLENRNFIEDRISNLSKSSKIFLLSVVCYFVNAMPDYTAIEDDQVLSLHVKSFLEKAENRRDEESLDPCLFQRMVATLSKSRQLKSKPERKPRRSEIISRLVEFHFKMHPEAHRYFRTSTRLTRHRLHELYDISSSFRKVGVFFGESAGDLVKSEIIRALKQLEKVFERIENPKQLLEEYRRAGIRIPCIPSEAVKASSFLCGKLLLPN